MCLYKFKIINDVVTSDKKAFYFKEQGKRLYLIKNSYRFYRSLQILAVVMVTPWIQDVNLAYIRSSGDIQGVF